MARGRINRGSYALHAESPTALDSDGDPARWNVFTGDAERVFTAAVFAERVLNGVLYTAEALHRARGAVLSRSRSRTWLTLITRALAAAGESLPARMAETVSAWCGEDRDTARAALKSLWAEDALLPDDRVCGFLHALPPRMGTAQVRSHCPEICSSSEL